MSNPLGRTVLEHFRDGGTLDDRIVDALYRNAHGLGPDDKVDRELVERWAFALAAKVKLSPGGDPASGFERDVQINANLGNRRRGTAEGR